MLFDVVDAKYIDGYKINLTFENGKNGIVDLEKYSLMKGVFNKFKDKKYFISFYVNKDLGTLCWPGGEDIAPETLLASLKE